MATLKKYDLTGKLLQEETIDPEFLSGEVCSQLIKDYIIALRANARQWSASTKSRAEVAHSGQKPHPQKGTGRARQGYLGATQYKGGGRVFAPRPKFDQFVHVNKKEKRAAIRHLLIEKIRNGKLYLLDAKAMKAPKTKSVADFLKKIEIDGKRVLFIESSVASNEESRECFVKSMRNIPRASYRMLQNANGYDLTLNHDVVVMTNAFDELKTLLKREA